MAHFSRGGSRFLADVFSLSACGSLAKVLPKVLEFCVGRNTVAWKAESECRGGRLSVLGFALCVGLPLHAV